MEGKSSLLDYIGEHLRLEDYLTQWQIDYFTGGDKDEGNGGFMNNVEDKQILE